MPDRHMVVVTAVCAVAVAVVFAVRAALRKRDGPSVDHVVSRREARRAADYWTEERMQAARPSR